MGALSAPNEGLQLADNTALLVGGGQRIADDVGKKNVRGPKACFIR